MQLDGLQKDFPEVEDRCLYRTAVSGRREKKHHLVSNILANFVTSSLLADLKMQHLTCTMKPNIIQISAVTRLAHNFGVTVFDIGFILSTSNVTHYSRHIDFIRHSDDKNHNQLVSNIYIARMKLAYGSCYKQMF